MSEEQVRHAQCEDCRTVINADKAVKLKTRIGCPHCGGVLWHYTPVPIGGGSSNEYAMMDRLDELRIMLRAVLKRLAIDD